MLFRRWSMEVRPWPWLRTTRSITKQPTHARESLKVASNPGLALRRCRAEPRRQRHGQDTMMECNMSSARGLAPLLAPIRLGATHA
jgi:hypothetical protein